MIRKLLSFFSWRSWRQLLETLRVGKASPRVGGSLRQAATRLR
ncbi:MAG: hypothetical protein V7K18_11995 [Nostoc sp.]